MTPPVPQEASLDRLFPHPATSLTDTQLLAAYGYDDGPVQVTETEAETAGRNLRAWVRFNFVSSVDGSATRGGLSGSLGDAADHRVFALLRRMTDVILVGAGTVRAEGYSGPLVSATDQQWRAARGLPPHPAVAYVSGSLDLDPDGGLFAQAPVRPLIFTAADADPARRRALSQVADVVSAGDSHVRPEAVRAELVARGLASVLCEGGPRLLGSFQAAGAVDELCLTLAPVLAGGTGPRISAGAPEAAAAGLQLRHVLRSGSTLLLRYVRPAPE